MKALFIAVYRAHLRIFSFRMLAPEFGDINLRSYAKYILTEGTSMEKRLLLANLRSRLIYQDKTVRLKEVVVEEAVQTQEATLEA